MGARVRVSASLKVEKHLTRGRGGAVKSSSYYGRVVGGGVDTCDSVTPKLDDTHNLKCFYVFFLLYFIYAFLNIYNFVPFIMQHVW